MLWWTIPLGVMVASGGVMFAIALRHVRDVAVVDPSTDPARRRRAKKRALFTARLERIGGARIRIATQAADRAQRWFLQHVKQWYKRAQALDRHYKRLARSSVAGDVGGMEARKQLLEEADVLMTKEAYTAAEQRLIEYLTLDAKNATVYERLGIVYLKTRQYDQARETFEHAHKLMPEDASIVVYLGELAMRDGKVKEAVQLFARAVALRPANPKYLDFMIESSILAGDVKRAREGVYLLKEANPENKKIAEFEARVAQM